MTKLEEVARAICRRYIEGETADGEWISPTGSLDGDVSFFWKDWVGEARAAIEALREPTDEVVEAGWGQGGAPFEIWQAMIDAILKEEGNG